MTTVDVTLVINTYNRASLVAGAIESALRQQPAFREVIVVDDGSTDETPTVLATFGDAIRVHRQPNAGLCAARNAGLAVAGGAWVGFLDDDDFLLPGVTASLATLTDRPGAGVVCGGIVYRSPRTGDADFSPPRRRDRMFASAMWSYMPGSFFVRRDLLEEVGGYRPELMAQHQTDLAWRLTDVLQRRHLTVESTPRPFVTMERADAVDRPLMRPELMLSGTEDMLEFHRDRFGLEPRAHADYLAIVGVNRIRLGDEPGGRQALHAAARVHPDQRSLVRAAIVSVPRIGPAWWKRTATSTATSTSSSIARPPGSEQLDLQLANAATLLPIDYEHNPQASAASHGTDYWEKGEASQDDRHQVPVYRLADRVARREGLRRIIDIGCGQGTKAAAHLAGPGREVLGVDQPSAVRLAPRAPGLTFRAADLGQDGVWAELASEHADLVVCADVIEHLDDPVGLLARLRELLRPGALLVLSTPDRSRADTARPKGPPANPRHVVEWTPDEMAALLAASGFEVLSVHNLLPRSYSATVLELKRVVWRALHRQPIPDRRRCMAFVARATVVP